MSLANITTILLAGTSLSVGAILGALRSKIFAIKGQSKLHYFFYGFSGFVLLISIYCVITYWNHFFNPPTVEKTNWFSISVLIAAIISSVALYFFTKKHLVFKDIYTTKELDPIVNKFTSNADKSEIKLFGGDLSFLGNSPGEIDINDQYTHLRSMAFTKVSILCETPGTQIQRMRYGKILYDMQEIELRFYNPDKADLRVRGRLTKLNGSDRLLMYNKIRSGVYEAIHTDTSSSKGALYNNIWELVWDLARRPNKEEIDSYIGLYMG